VNKVTANSVIPPTTEPTTSATSDSITQASISDGESLASRITAVFDLGQ
jgi:hypothetical protein